MAVDNHQDAAEQLALVLTNHGLQRMTARVLAALLFTEQPTTTAGELADRLQASAGAISGAIKMLTSVGLVERVPAPAQPPGSLPAARQRMGGPVHQSERSARRDAEGGRGRRGGGRRGGSLAHHRLTQMRDFYDFLLSEIPALLDRWHEEHQHRRSGPGGNAPR